MLKDYFLMALDNIKHRGLRSWLTMIGIFIGIAGVVSLISLGQGLEEAVIGQFKSLSADTLIVQSSSSASYLGPPGTGAVRKLNEHDLELIKSVPGVKMAIPRLIRSVKIEYNNVAGFKYLASIPDNQEQINYIYNIADLKIYEGRLIKPGDKKKILIGADFIKKEQFGKEVKLGSNLKIQGQSFEVIGILDKTSSLEINNAALMPESDLKEILNITDEIDLIAVKVVSKERVEETAELIKRKMRRDRNQKEGEEDFSVQTPIRAFEAITTVFNIVNLVVIGIAIVSLFVGGVGIANTMYTSVLERYKEIGVMKAVGARNSDILQIFLIESGLLGLAGGIVGAILGISFALFVSFAANSYFGQELLAVQISYPLILLSISFSFLIGILSGLSPAYQASQLKPVQALRA